MEILSKIKGLLGMDMQEVDKKFRRLESEMSRIYKNKMFTAAAMKDVREMREESEKAQKLIIVEYMQKELDYVKEII